MKLKNVALLDLASGPIMLNDAPLTVGTVMINAVLAPTEDNKARPAVDAVRRYELAKRLHLVEKDDPFEIPDDLVKDLGNDVLRLYATIVSGQMLLMMALEKN